MSLPEREARPVYMEALLRLVRERPDDIAVVHDGGSVSHAVLWSQATSLAAWLGRQGLSPGDVVGISVKNEYRHLVVTLAAMHAGLGQVVLSTHDPVAQREGLAARTGAVAVIAEATDAGMPGLPLMLADFDFAAGAGEAVAQPGGGAALYLTSSGTTGKPKLIPLAQRHLVAQAATFRHAPHKTVFLRPSSIEFNNSKRQRLYALISGDINVFADPLHFGIREACAAHGVTWLGLAAVHARALVADGGGALPAGVSVRMGGSAVPQRLRRDILANLGASLFVGYGTSETGSIATAWPDDHVGEGDTLGTVHSGIDFEIVNGEDRPVPPGAVGSVRIRSAGMPAAYHDDAIATARAFRGGWFYPGDMARRGDNGRLYFEGRSDDMMTLASINIFPAEIERAVEGFPGVVESAAFSMTSSEFGDVPMLAVVGRGVSAETVLAHARKTLGLRAPRKVFIVDALPRGREGKVLRRELQKLLSPQSMAGVTGG